MNYKKITNVFVDNTTVIKSNKQMFTLKNRGRALNTESLDFFKF